MMRFKHLNPEKPKKKNKDSDNEWSDKDEDN